MNCYVLETKWTQTISILIALLLSWLSLSAHAQTVTTRAVSSSRINLSWTQARGKVQFYILYRNGAQIATLPGSQLSYRDRGLSASTKYTYQLAVALQPVSATTSAAVTQPPPAPTPDPEPAPAPDPTPAPVPVPNPSALKHGKDLTVAMVGPAAIGITSFVNAGSLNLEATASYIKRIPTSATYDGYTVTGPHILVQGASFPNGLDITTSVPVVIRGCKIRNAGYWSLFVRSGSPVYLLYSDIGGTSSTGTGQSGEVIMTGNSGHNVFARNYISNGGDAFSMGSKNDLVAENFMEKFNSADGAHNDGLQAAGNNDGLLIVRNKILLDQGQTGCINLAPWGGSVAQYVTVDSNYFAGGGYTFYGGVSVKPSNHILVTNNVFGYDFFPKIGGWGAVAYWEGGNGNVWSNNVDTNGKAVNP